jgi:hypothetical protein
MLAMRACFVQFVAVATTTTQIAPNAYNAMVQR